ncbi:MAG: DUF2652 domain-containing protein [Bacteroidota bacterium]
MAQNALLFIPDISGFTEFVHHTEITHSQHIISELLELLLDANTIGLQLAEIEGDALFMYKLVDTPSKALIEQQIETMYMAFSKHINLYEHQRICHCGACSSAYNLKLKFIVHFGEIDFIKVKNAKKPYGSPVIQIHRLLKNDIDIKEYALITKAVFETEGQINTMTTIYDFGEITYSYIDLEPLKLQLPEASLIPDNVPKHKIYSTVELFNMPILDLYEVISNFDYRLLWVKGIDELEYEKNKVNRAGLKHRCIINKNKEVIQTTISKKVASNKLVYGESTDAIPFTKKLSVYYILEEKQDEKTEMAIEIFADLKPLGLLMRPLLKKNFKKVVSENFKALILLIDSGFRLDQKNNYNEDH